MNRLFPLALAALLAWRISRRFQRVELHGQSMLPAYRPGDWLIVDRRAYRDHPPRPGHVILVHDPREFDRLLVKRVAAVTADGSLRLHGDNTAASTDSRDFGVVPPFLVEGRVIARYWPRPSLASR